MRNYFLLFILTAFLFSCEKETINTDPDSKKLSQEYLWAPLIQVQKGNNQATLWLTDPRPLSEYIGTPPVNPDYFEVYLSDNNISFTFFKKIDITTTQVTIPNLTNGKSYYFKVVSVKKNMIPLITAPVSTIPSETETVTGYGSLPSNVDRLLVSPDRKFATFTTDNNLFQYKSTTSATVGTIGQNIFWAQWANHSNKLVYLTSKLVDNAMYPFQLKLWDAETNTTTTLIDVDYEKYYLSAAVFSPDDNSVAFLSSEGNSNKYLNNVWTMDLASKSKRKITNFDASGFMPAGFLSWGSNASEIYLDGLYTNERTGIYKIETSTGKLTPVIISDWQETMPSISPDNKKLAFVSYRSGKGEVWLYDTEAEVYQQITGGTSQRFDARYSHIQWLSENEILVSLFEGNDNKAFKVVLN